MAWAWGAGFEWVVVVEPCWEETKRDGQGVRRAVHAHNAACIMCVRARVCGVRSVRFLSLAAQPVRVQLNVSNSN